MENYKNLLVRAVFRVQMVTHCPCTALLNAELFIEPPPDTQRKRRRGERGIGVAMGCYLSQASPSPPFPSLPPTARLSHRLRLRYQD